MGWLALTGCQGPSSARQAELQWPDAEIGALAREPLEAVASDDAAARVRRLDRLMDLFDRARFASDAAARAQLWRGLGQISGGSAPDPSDAGSTGPVATREAAARLLAEATAIEDRFGAKLPAEAAEFLADAIMLLSVDVNAPHDAESLEIQTLAFRSLLDVGHPRVVDNARWRLYDHLRAVLVAAAGAPAPRRLEIGVHAMLLAHEELTPWLGDAAVHVRAALPPAQAITKLGDELLAAIDADARWSETVDGLLSAHVDATQAFAQVWPADRSEVEGLARMRGSGRAERYAPVVRVDEDQIHVGVGQPGTSSHRRGDGRLPAVLSSVAARDGQSTLLVSASASTNAPATFDLLQACAKSAVGWLEFAVSEPRIEGEGTVITQAPLRVVRTGDRGPEARALRQARVLVRLGGRGAVTFADEDRVDVGALPLNQLAVRIEQLRIAFPREGAVRIELQPDLQYEQLVDGLLALLGPADEPHYKIVAWWADAPVTVDADPGAPATPGQLRLDARLALAKTKAAWRVDKPFTFKAQDERAFVALLAALEACRLESEAAPGSELRFDLSFEAGAVTKAVATAGGDRQDAVQACLEEETQAFRLRSHQDRFDVVIAEASMDE